MVPRILCVFLAAVLAMAQPAAGPAATARKAVDLLLGQKYAELEQMFTAEMSKAFPDADLKKLGGGLQNLGAPQTIGEVKVNPLGGVSVAVVPVKFASIEVAFQVSVDAEGRVAGLYLRQMGAAQAPPWQRPAYSKPDLFKERDATVGCLSSGQTCEDPWKLPATLSVPVGKGPFPAVVLVHGSGPGDRDETVMANKPFKDLAEGLASRGIVVLRYEKRTRQYAARTAASSKFTVQEETIDDALKALALVRAQPEVDPKRVYILGHSLGGNLAPRIAEEDGKLAGLVIVAGNVRPLEDMVVEQSEYLGASAAEVAGMRAQAAKVKTLEPADEDGPPVRVGPVSAPVAYWLDLKGYDAAALAKKLPIPMLILQGERDYQVTMKDFEMWKAALAGRKDVTLKSYPELNHLFIAGQGRSLPAEYNRPGHVAQEAIEEIAKFVAK